LLGFVSTAYLARVLGNEGFGVINLGMAILSYGMIFTSPGLHIIGTKIASQNSMRDEAIIAQVTSLRFMLCVLATVVIAACSLYLVHDSTVRLTIIFYSASLLPFAFQIAWFFQGKQRISAIGVSQSLSLLFFVVIVLLAVTTPSDILIVPIAYLANTTLNAALLFMTYFRKKESTAGKYFLTEAIRGWKSLLHQALPVGAASILGQFIFNLPVILLGVFATSIDIGNLSAASRLIFFLLAIDRAIYVLFYPLVARTFAVNPAKLGEQVDRILGYLLLVSLPLCTGGLVLAPDLISLAYGAQYKESSFLFQILLFYFLFTILNSVFAYVVIAVGRERRYSTIIVGICSLLSLTLIPLTYYWKGVGASCGMVGGELLMMALMYRECRKSISPKLAAAAMRPVLCSLFMGAMLLSLPHIGLIPSLGLGIASYFLSMILLKGITKDDVIFLKERFI
jgi:PST family polysaccharide transporter